MNVVGHGIDLVNIAEMRRWIEDSRDPLIPRCFVQAELDEVGDGVDRIERLAGRFAAKEAVLKAIGTGFGAGVAFTDVMIHRAPGAAPEVPTLGRRGASRHGVGSDRLAAQHQPCRRHSDGERSRIGGGGSSGRLMIGGRAQKGDAPRV